MPTPRIKQRLVFAASLALAAFAAPAAAPEEYQTLTFGGNTRAYVVRAPTALAPGGPRVPLVLVLHGGGGNAANAEQMTGFTAKARAEGFIVVYPEGSGRLPHRLLTWNAGHCCGYAREQRVDDVGFVNALLDQLIASYPVDTRRIYATGMSNGGMMVHRLGIGLAHRFAAIAPVVGTVFGDEPQPAASVSALMINGLLDENVPPQGGAAGGRGARAWDGTPARPALEQATFWARADGCAAAPRPDDSGARTLWRYTCPHHRAVELYLVKDNGHAWPGGQQGSRRGDKPGSSLNATDVIWAFFKAHPQ